MSRPNHAARDRQIVADYLSGMTLAQVGERWGVTAVRVCQIVRYRAGPGAGSRSIAARGNFFSVEGLAVHAAKPGPPVKHPARNRRVCALAAEGFTFDEIADALGISRNAVAGAKWRTMRRGAGA